MKKIRKIIAKNYNEKLYRNKLIKNKIKLVNDKFRLYNLNYSFNNEIDYFKNYIIYNSILNKELFEQTYEANRNKMIEIWDTIEFNKKNSFSNMALDQIKDKTKSFIVDDVVITIAFFDTLLNSLYDKEIAVLELPQFFKLTKSFKERMINIDEYYPHTYINGFSDGLYLGNYNDKIILFLSELKKICLLNNEYIEFIGIEYNDSIDIKDFLDLYYGNDPIKLIEYILSNKLYNDKTVKKLNNYLRKLVKRSSKNDK